MGRGDDPKFEPERFRGQLRALAERGLGRLARSKVEPSDVVQQTLLDAVRVPGQYRGGSDAEMVGWLRRLLACNLADVRRAFGRARRDASREVSIERAGGETRMSIETVFASGGSSPSGQLEREESAARVAEAIGRLPEANRLAVTLRYLEGRPIAEISARLDRSPAAVAGLLKRGLAALRVALPAETPPSREDSSS